MKRNLVIGSEGFVGKAFCKYLINIGEEVVHFDLKRDEKEDARFAKLNFENIDAVYFLAWDVGGAKYLYKEDTQLTQLHWNLDLLKNTMTQLEEKEIPFLYVSSQLAEEADTVYGVTKRLGEVWTKLLKGTCVRLWNVYGPIEELNEKSHVVSDFVNQAVHKGEINMLTTGEEQRRFIHIDDVCKAFHYSLSEKLTGVYDVTSEDWVKVLDVAKIIGELTEAKVIPGQKIGSTPLTPLRDKIPGWEPKVTLREALTQMIANAKKNA